MRLFIYLIQILLLFALVVPSFRYAADDVCKILETEFFDYHRAATAQDKSRIVKTVAERNNIPRKQAEEFLRQGNTQALKPVVKQPGAPVAAAKPEPGPAPAPVVTPRPAPPVLQITDPLARRNVDVLTSHLNNANVSASREVSGGHTAQSLENLAQRDSRVVLSNLSKPRRVTIKLPGGREVGIYIYSVNAQVQGGNKLVKTVFAAEELTLDAKARRFVRGPALATKEEFDSALKSLLADVRAKAENTLTPAFQKVAKDKLPAFSNGVGFEYYWSTDPETGRPWISTIMVRPPSGP